MAPGAANTVHCPRRPLPATLFSGQVVAVENPATNRRLVRFVLDGLTDSTIEGTEHTAPALLITPDQKHEGLACNLVERPRGAAGQSVISREYTRHPEPGQLKSSCFRFELSRRSRTLSGESWR